MRITIYLCTLLLCFFIGHQDLVQSSNPEGIDIVFVLAGVWALFGDIVDLSR